MNTEYKTEEVTVQQALVTCYQIMNRPSTSGTEWVRYRRDRVDLVLETLKQILIQEGYTFTPEPPIKKKRRK